MAPCNGPGINRKLPLSIVNESGRIPDQRLQHGGFAGAVAADERDLFALLRLAVNFWTTCKPS